MTRALTLLAASLLITFALSGCEYFEDDPPAYNPSDPRAQSIGGSITAALEALDLNGTEFFYEAMADSVRDRCTLDQFNEDFDGIPHQMRLKYINSIDFRDSGVAVVDLTLITPNGDEDQEWTMTPAVGTGWYILSMPGLETCAQIPED